MIRADDFTLGEIAGYVVITLWWLAVPGALACAAWLGWSGVRPVAAWRLAAAGLGGAFLLSVLAVRTELEAWFKGNTLVAASGYAFLLLVAAAVAKLMAWAVLRLR